MNENTSRITHLPLLRLGIVDGGRRGLDLKHGWAEKNLRVGEGSFDVTVMARSICQPADFGTLMRMSFVLC